MNTKTIVFLLFIFECSNYVKAQYVVDPIRVAEFLVESHMEITRLPGVQVALLKEDSMIWNQGFGFSDQTDSSPVTPHTRFRIASVSKSVTSLALDELVQEGALNPHEPVQTYLPEYPYRVTAHQLASSTAGIRHYTANDPDLNTVHYPTIKAALERFAADPLLFEPGTDHHYSSYGWVLLAAAMERAAGVDFFQLMETLWNDLGMHQTSFDYPDTPCADCSKFYVSKGKGREEAPTDNRSFMYPGGGYLSTATDLVQMAGLFMGDEYLTNDTRLYLTTSVSTVNGGATGYALGWESGLGRTGDSVVFHSGSLPSARSHLVFYPGKDLAFSWLANSGDGVFFNEREAHAIAELFLNEGSDSIADISGTWTVSTTSLWNKKSKGVLSMEMQENGILAGTITFKRSKKKKEFPLVMAGRKGDYIHLIAVTPMFLDIYLKQNGKQLTGYWLHDFDVLGLGDTDAYWEPRTITLTRQEP